MSNIFVAGYLKTGDAWMAADSVNALWEHDATETGIDVVVMFTKQHDKLFNNNIE